MTNGKWMRGDRYKAVAWMWQEGRFVRATEMQPHKGYWVYAIEQAEIEVQLPWGIGRSALGAAALVDVPRVHLCDCLDIFLRFCHTVVTRGFVGFISHCVLDSYINWWSRGES